MSASNTVTVSREEYKLLSAVFAGAIEIRDQGVQPFNRLPQDMRLAITTLVAHYREQGYDDRGLPTGNGVAGMFALAREATVPTRSAFVPRNAFTPVTADSISDPQILELWKCGAIDTRERDRAIRPARKPYHVAWRNEARKRCAAVFNARGGK